MIKELKIINLFGQFNYHIVFKDAGITIITGPNGFGKSTVLKIIESLGEKDLYDLCQFPFEKIIAKTTNQSITVEKNNDSVIVNNCALLFFPERIMEKWHKRKGIPFVERIAPNTFLDLRYDKILTSQEYSTLITEYNDDNDISDRLILINYDQSKSAKKECSKYKELQKQLDLFKQDIGNIKFIKEQRLIRKETIDEGYYLREEKTKVIEVITELPEKMMSKIKDVVLKYSEISSKLDSSFPKRLFEAEKTISQDEYVNSLSKIISQQEKIQDYNLIKDLHIISIGSYKEDYEKALKVYIDDTTEKLSVYNDLIKRLDTFVQTINRKLYNKKIIVSSEFGLKVIREDGQELDLNKLSSGEQQIIVLYYELIFEIQDKTILMIDEPEISLHVAWQRTLMDDLQKIINLKDDDLFVIIATHSPQVINNNWNTIVDLGEQNGNK